MLMAPGLQLGQFCTKSGKTKARHVKMLILSLLSKPLPIKGREARLAAKVEGRTGANTRAVHSQAARGPPCGDAPKGSDDDM